MSDVIKHHGILGQKWGVRRFQKYPEGYSGNGKFVGKTASGKELTKKEFKKDRKELKKDIKKLSFANNYLEGYRKNDSIKIDKKLAKARTDKKINEYKNKKYTAEVRDKVSKDIKDDINKLVSIAENQYGMKFNKNKYTKEVSALRSRFKYASKAAIYGKYIANEKIDTILSGYGTKYGYTGKTLR